MAIYILKFSACLFVFWIVYFLFLERQQMHHFKRFYLLSAFVLAIVIPTLTIIEYVEPVVTTFETVPTFINIEPDFVEAPIEATPFWNLETTLWFIYGIGVLLLAIRFLINLFQIQRRISNNETIHKRPFIYVLLEDNLIPHSFFRYIFFNKTRYESLNIPEEVILHEETHAKQLHSIDIIFLEVLQIVFWFHPLIYILKHHIKLNHEFLADQAVLKQGADTKTYQNILLQFSSNTQDYQLTSAINYSSIKKRFTVMKTQTSKTRIWLSTLLVLPIIAILFYSFAEKEYVEKEESSTIDHVEHIKDELKKAKELQINYVDQNVVEIYLKKYDIYEALRTTEPHYINKSKQQQEGLDDMFSDLGGLYFRMSKENKAKVKRPISPIKPYVQITLNGKTYYKKRNELTAEEIATFPPPPPPPAKQKTSKGGPNPNDTQSIYNPSFLEFIIEMENEGASFYLNDEEISAKEAKAIAANNKGKRTDILTQLDVNEKYVVKLSNRRNNVSPDKKVGEDKEIQEKPTLKEVAEYNDWAKQLKKETLAAQEDERNGKTANYPIVKQKDLIKYVGIYKRMTSTQKENSVELPIADDELKNTGLKFPPPPPPAKQKTSNGGPNANSIEDYYFNDSEIKKEYLKKFKQYETFRHTKPHFLHKTKAEKSKMNNLWLELRKHYIYKLSEKDQKSVELPITPFAPYVKINKDGKSYYKVYNQLTPEEEKTEMFTLKSSPKMIKTLELLDKNDPIIIPIETYTSEKPIKETATKRLVYITISEDGTYSISKDNTFKNFEAVSLKTLESVIANLSPIEIKNTFVFSKNKDSKKFRSKPAKSPEYQDDIEVYLVKNDIRYTTIEYNGKYREHPSFQLALDNRPSEKLKSHVSKLAKLFKKYGITNLTL
ncbi:MULTISPECIES: M56 family metallopeptidase [Winogradskyella]|uniref:M56 family metallopeptidase n=1 Tax=Winogradskyella TaxID=286104 RepID=UPI0015CC0E41|nr:MULTISPECIES: M56 family metallopeptidase [Winogradskyella]QXP77522.1 M56 family metallopeptidase [Winogradskyella sp. HaHa_3_26]